MTVKKEDILLIDIEKVLKSKIPRAYKFIPGFIIRWMIKTLRQEGINEAFISGAALKNKEFADHCIRRLGATIESEGLENIPLTGGGIIASNHPLGGLDGMAIFAEASKKRNDVRFIVNGLLALIPNFNEVFIGVNKLGKSSKESLVKVESLYADGNMVLVFPAGLCSRMTDGVIKDIEWQKSFISRSIKYNIPVIPAFISGRNTPRFYRLAKIRQFFKIKANIEMFFLPDEMFKQKGHTIRIIFGKPIPASFFDKEQSIVGWAEMMRNFVYTLKNNPDADFDEFVKNQDL